MEVCMTQNEMLKCSVVAFTSVLAILIAGCGGPVNFSQAPKAADANAPTADGVYPCEVNPPQFIMGGQVLNFGLTNSFGLNISYDISGKTTGTVGAQWQNYTATLAMEGYANYPFSANPAWMGKVSTTQSENQIGVTLDFSGVKVNPVVSFTDAVDVVAATILQNMVTSVATYATSNNIAWEGHLTSHIQNDLYLM